MTGMSGRRITVSGDGLTAKEEKGIAAVGGGVIVYPTDTFYGIGADPLSPEGLAKVYALKGRPAGEPLLVLVDSVATARDFAAEVTGLHERLMGRFWPGPLTILFPARPGLPAGIVSREGKVALRLPGSLLCRRILAAAGGALTGTSANRSGAPPARSVAAMDRALIAGADLVVDGGTSAAANVSTLVNIEGGRVTALREGTVKLREIMAFLAAERG